MPIPTRLSQPQMQQLIDATAGQVQAGITIMRDEILFTRRLIRLSGDLDLPPIEGTLDGASVRYAIRVEAVSINAPEPGQPDIRAFAVSVDGYRLSRTTGDWKPVSAPPGEDADEWRKDCLFAQLDNAWDAAEVAHAALAEGLDS